MTVTDETLVNTIGPKKVYKKSSVRFLNIQFFVHVSNVYRYLTGEVVLKIKMQCTQTLPLRREIMVLRQNVASRNVYVTLRNITKRKSF